MNGAGFIQQMINTMRDNRALKTSQQRKNRKESGDQRAGKTKLKFPKGSDQQLQKVKHQHSKRSKIQWIVIYTFFTLFFSVMMWFVFS